MSRIRIERVTVRAAHVEALVALDPESTHTAACPGFAQRIVELLPGLERHSCENDSGRRFVDEAADTEVAHVLEHVAAELMALSGSPRSLKAETSWNFAEDGAGVFRVRLAYDLDVVAIGALREGAALVDWALAGEGPAPEVERVVERLARIRAV